MILVYLSENKEVSVTEQREEGWSGVGIECEGYELRVGQKPDHVDSLSHGKVWLLL